MLQVVVGIIMNKSNQLLIAQRPKHVYLGGLWEFPGGKVEFDETSLEALQRELKEEVGIEVTRAESFLTLTHTYPERTVLLEAWQVTTYQGKPYGQEGQVIDWVSLADMANYKMLPTTEPIIKSLYKL